LSDFEYKSDMTNYYTKVDSSNIFLGKVDASNIYLKITDSSSNYLKITDALAGFLSKDLSSNAVTVGTAQKQGGLSVFGPTTFITGLPTASGNLTSNNQLVTKSIVDASLNALSNSLQTGSNIWTGLINTWNGACSFNSLPTASGTLSLNNQLVTKSIVDASINSFKTGSNTWSGSNTFSGILSVGNKLNVATNTTLISENFSISSFPLDEYYSVVAGANAGDSAITINLPAVSSSNAGTKVHFRIVSGQGDVTFSSNTLIYSLSNATGSITIGNGNFSKTKITLVVLKKNESSYAYYEI